VIEGPQGGLRCIPADGDSGDSTGGLEGDISEDEAQEAIQNAVESVDTTDTVETQTGHPKLSDEQIEQFNQTLEEEVGEDAANEFNERVTSWKANSYNDDAQTHERAFARAFDLEGDIRNGELDGDDPTREQVTAARAYGELSQQFIRDNFGEEVEVERGLAEFGMGQLIATWANDPEQEDIDFNLSAMSNFSTDDDVAEEFTERNQTAKVSQTIPADDVVAATDFVSDHGQRDEAELSIAGGGRSVDTSNIEFAVSGETLPTDISEMDEVMARRIGEYISQESDNMEDTLTDEGRELLFELKEEFDLLHPTEDEL
jgi:hypothetical protein